MKVLIQRPRAKNLHSVKFKVLMASMKMAVLWDVSTYSPVDIYRCFGRASLQGDDGGKTTIFKLHSGHTVKDSTTELTTMAIRHMVYITNRRVGVDIRGWNTHHHYHHWLDSPTWAPAFLRNFCQLSFSIAKFLQFFTPKVLISCITSSSHLS
jgi:hypothetical protein